MLWLEVGNALLVGRQTHKADRAFAEWVRENGFGDMHRSTRANAMWLSENWAEVSRGATPPDLTHPTNIRAWFNDQQASQALPEDLQTLTPEPTLSLPQRDAEKVAKVLLRAASNDEGADIAKRHVDAIACKHGVTVEKLTEAAKVGAPAIVGAVLRGTFCFCQKM